MTPNQKRARLVERDMKMLQDGDFRDVLMMGYVGYDNMNDDEIDMLYEEAFRK